MFVLSLFGAINHSINAQMIIVNAHDARFGPCLYTDLHSIFLIIRKVRNNNTRMLDT